MLNIIKKLDEKITSYRVAKTVDNLGFKALLTIFFGLPSLLLAFFAFNLGVSSFHVYNNITHSKGTAAFGIILFAILSIFGCLGIWARLFNNHKDMKTKAANRIKFYLYCGVASIIMLNLKVYGKGGLIGLYSYVLCLVGIFLIMGTPSKKENEWKI